MPSRVERHLAATREQVDEIARQLAAGDLPGSLATISVALGQLVDLQRVLLGSVRVTRRRS